MGYINIWKKITCRAKVCHYDFGIEKLSLVLLWETRVVCKCKDEHALLFKKVNLYIKLLNEGINY